MDFSIHCCSPPQLLRVPSSQEKRSFFSMQSVVFVKPEPKSQTSPCTGEVHQTSHPAGETSRDTARELVPSLALEEGDGNGESNANTCGFGMERFSDVSEEEGWISIPYKEIQDNWYESVDIQSLRSLDRSFVFSGEQIQILACLSESKEDAEIITPFKVVEVMNKTVQRKLSDNGTSTPSGDGELSPDGQFATQNGDIPAKESLDSQTDVSDGESIMSMEDHKRRT